MLPSREHTAGSHLLAYVIVALLFCAITGFFAAASAQLGELVGIVIDQKTEQPVAAASVRVGSAPEVFTDQRGAFRVANLPLGKQLVRVAHVGYGERSIEVEIRSGSNAVRLAVAETAIVLQPLTVEALSNEELRSRGAGFRRAVISREQIAQTEGTNMRLSDVLRVHVPSVRVRRVDRIVGAPICIELRTIRAVNSGECLSPAVYLDGVPITNATTLYDNLDPSMIERMEVIPAAEAGVRYGSGALYGALLIETRRPGRVSDPKRPAIPQRNTSYDWGADQQGHRTAVVFLTAAAGNAAGLAAGLAIAKQCLRLRAPSYDGLVSDCNAIGSVAAAGVALALPALGNALGTRLAGQTDSSRGLFWPATLGATMMLIPGYALVFTGRRNDSDSLRGVGYVVMAVGAPFVSTAADYLFRRVLSDRD